MNPNIFLRIVFEIFLLIIIGFLFFEVLNIKYPEIDKLAIFTLGVIYSLSCSFYISGRINFYKEQK